MSNLKTFILSTLLLLFLVISCRKEEKITTDPSAKLEFSEDTIIFDTVFTTVGSVTKWLKVRNKNKNAVKISSISIMGNTTQYIMNVDGISGRTVKDIEIPGEDSIFVFVEVTVDPNNELLPFLITDQIRFITNGNDQRVDLVAFGQNAIFYTPTVKSNNFPDFTIIDTVNPITRWDSTLPIVIYGFAVVDEGDHLIIEEGTKIYFHGGAGLWVFEEGSIEVNGTKEHPVIFRGDRLDSPYDELSGQWDRIWINEGSVNNVFNYAIIKNAFIGIQAETLPIPLPRANISDNGLILNNTIIENCSAIGLLSTNYIIQAHNLLVTNCGQYNLAVTGGGAYRFNNSTFANYWNESTRNTPAVFLSNSYTDNSTLFVSNLQCDFNSSIVYGNNENEFEIEKNDLGDLNFNFNHALIRTEIDTSMDGNYTNIVLNPENRNIFKNPFDNDYHLLENSPAIDKGTVFVGDPELDLDQNSRTADAAPDIGAYEFAP